MHFGHCWLSHSDLALTFGKFHTESDDVTLNSKLDECETLGIATISTNFFFQIYTHNQWAKCWCDIIHMVWWLRTRCIGDTVGWRNETHGVKTMKGRPCGLQMKHIRIERLYRMANGSISYLIHRKRSPIWISPSTLWIYFQNTY